MGRTGRGVARLGGALWIGFIPGGAGPRLRGADGRWWRAIFEAPAGQNLAPGTYTDARRYGPNYPYPGFTLAGDGRAWGSSTSEFTINEIEFDPDDVLLRFGATFAQRCENRLDAARGGLEYRLPVGDVTPPASVADLRVTRAGNTATVSWTNPSDSDHATTIVRWHGLAEGDNAAGTQCLPD